LYRFAVVISHYRTPFHKKANKIFKKRYIFIYIVFIIIGEGIEGKIN